MGEYNVGYCVSARLALIQYLRQNRRFRIAYLPLEESDFAFVCRAVYNKKNMLFIVEEVSQYCSSTSTDPEFARCIQLGRHANLDIVYTGQRFADIARRLTSQTDLFCCFRISEPRDLDAIQARFGPVVAERISKLGDLRYLKLQVGKDNSNVTENVVSVADRRAGGGLVHRGSASDASGQTARSG